MPEQFHIKTQVFEGPLDLLLSLIEKRKLLINDVSLSQVTDDFIAHIKQEQNFPLSDSANFILIASTLMLIKSKSLLPTLELSQEEQTSIEDLNKRLQLYQKIKELSRHVEERFGKHMIYPKRETKHIKPVFSPEEGMTVPGLLTAIREVLKNLPKKELLPKAIVRKVISLEEMIVSLTERIQSNLRMSFKEFSGAHNKTERVHIIVSFLAMLELVKQGIIDVNQEAQFGDIHMETQGDVGVPRYN